VEVGPGSAVAPGSPSHEEGRVPPGRAGLLRGVWLEDVLVPEQRDDTGTDHPPRSLPVLSSTRRGEVTASPEGAVSQQGHRPGR
jgi:hypothetical protein